MKVTRLRFLTVPMLLLALAACRDVGTTEAGTGGQMGLSIQEPQDGAQVSGKVNLAVSVEGAEIGPTDSGAMHLHVYVDDSGEYEVVETTETTVPVPNGEHSLRVVLAHPNHEETEISDEVTFSVSAGARETGDTGGGYGGGYG